MTLSQLFFMSRPTKFHRVYKPHFLNIHFLGNFQYCWHSQLIQTDWTDCFSIRFWNAGRGLISTSLRLWCRVAAFTLPMPLSPQCSSCDFLNITSEIEQETPWVLKCVDSFQFSWDTWGTHTVISYTQVNGCVYQQIPIPNIRPSPLNPRKHNSNILSLYLRHLPQT